MKINTIDSCIQCQFFSEIGTTCEDQCWHPKSGFKLIPDALTIPIWCPLPDADELFQFAGFGI